MLSEAEAFAERLRRICDTHDRAELRSYGRQALIARELDVSEETSRKWFSGVMRPRPGKMKRLAEFLGVDEVWLTLGRDPDVSAREQRILAKNASGAAYFIRGFLEMSGASTSVRSQRDNREYIDFFATINGDQVGIFAAFGRELNNKYIVQFPAEHHELRILAVLADRSEFCILDMSSEFLDRFSSRKAGDRAVDIERSTQGEFVTGGYIWPRLRPGKLPKP
ncbi:helix-turn-helix transcriptional regulator [Roseomonas sp. PWR1]|uniref:Helix-turn-helix transcriptional regulator n=1 Tax=Roseomonas nitratireducens TaxID=2820810 RepID=A0ABS4ANK2_9PROT|nr:helix-turn-helix transcriptional regulator [Neoroseomonas nitratireducens]MBP0462416.1 helix-turn-helix transcriptional regulator [Neoroseomonas nitratireducens]